MKEHELRDTVYARELVRATLDLPTGNQARLERLYVKKRQREEVRFSWWKEGRMAQRPLDLTEDEFLDLLRVAIKQEVFTAHFLWRLKELLSSDVD